MKIFTKKHTQDRWHCTSCKQPIPTPPPDPDQPTYIIQGWNTRLLGTKRNLNIGEAIEVDIDYDINGLNVHHDQLIRLQRTT